MYGSADYRINSKLDAEDIIRQIPTGMKCIWLRDEGHIKTYRWDEFLLESCDKVINFSATNTYGDVQCNFTQTMMLRTVNQTCGTPEDAIIKLLEIKEAHKNVPNYNPCAIFRCVGYFDIEDSIIKMCKKHKLKYINISDDSYIMSELCEDNNEYDVIINKFKIQEGIDIRRAHVLYMDNQPGNNATTIQVIGRCRRNALLYRDDIDILAPENDELLKLTRECYVFYNVTSVKIDSDETGELYMAFCNHISCEALKANTTITVNNGQLPNGLYVIELEGCTGTYRIETDKNTGFNIVNPLTEFYATEKKNVQTYLYTLDAKISSDNIKYLPYKTNVSKALIDLELKDQDWEPGIPCYWLTKSTSNSDVALDIEKYDLSLVSSFFSKYKEPYTKEKILSLCKTTIKQNHTVFLDTARDKDFINVSYSAIDNHINEFISQNESKKGFTQFCKSLSNIDTCKIPIYTEENPRPFYDGISWAASSYEDFRSFFDDCSIQLIKYFLIMHKCNSCTNEYLDKLLKRLVNNVSDLYQYKAIINWHVFIALILDPSLSQYKLVASVDPIDEYLPELTYSVPYNKKLKITPESTNKAITKYFHTIDQALATFLNESNRVYVSRKAYLDDLTKEIIVPIQERIERTQSNLEKNVVDKCVRSFKSLWQPLSPTEQFLMKKGFIKPHRCVSQKTVDENNFVNYTKTINDCESAVIGTDLMHQIKVQSTNEKSRFPTYDTVWIETTAVTAKTECFSKLNSFISRKYQNELEYAKTKCFTGKNTFNIDKRCNSMIGYCVEYYSKYLIYGESFLEREIDKAIMELYTTGRSLNYREYEAHKNDRDDYLIVRACMLKYKEMMVHSFGEGVARIIRGISTEKLAQRNYDEFINLVIELGKRTAEFVRNTLYAYKTPTNNYDPNLSIRHISGLADYITEDTILDVKVRNNIDEKCIRQVLAYHYLSTKRTDLHIKRVIIYDASSNKSITIPISSNNFENALHK